MRCFLGQNTEQAETGRAEEEINCTFISHMHTVLLKKKSFPQENGFSP
jgi:hypothetical protein